MNKKAVIGGLCTIVVLGFWLLNRPKEQTYKPIVEMITAQDIKGADVYLDSYLNEFQKRVISQSESYQMTSEITNSGCGGSAYNTQTSNNFQNSIFYLGDGFSPLAPAPFEPGVIDIN